MAASSSSVSNLGIRPLDRPRKLDRYELIAPIGSGGMATVYLGLARGVGGFERVVAIKVCHLHLRDQGDFVEMFLDEARLAAQIHHPNVVSTIDVRDEEELYLVMDFVDGGHLSKIQKKSVAKGHQIPIPITMKIFHDALEGLHAVHELRDLDGHLLNLIHRDVSPQNILVGVDGITRIADFGVAKAEQRAASTKPGEIKGKYPYMAPEQLRGADLTRQVDIFSASIVFWEVLTGARLFKGIDESDTVSKVLSGPIRRPSTLRREVSTELDKIVKRGLERPPQKRFKTAKELANAIDQCGTSIASAEEVGEYVGELLKEHIEAQRNVLRSVRGIEPASYAVQDNPKPKSSKSEVLEVSKSSIRLRPHRRGIVWFIAAILVTALGGSVLYLVYVREPSEGNVPPGKLSDERTRQLVGDDRSPQVRPSSEIPQHQPIDGGLRKGFGEGGPAEPTAKTPAKRRRFKARPRKAQRKAHPPPVEYQPKAI